MTDLELKLLLALIGTICAFLGAITGAVIFFWKEGRNKYLSQLAGLRLLVLASESLTASLRANRLDNSEIKLDWFTQHLDGIFKDEEAYVTLKNLITLRSEILSPHANAELSSLISKAERVKANSEQCLHNHMRRWKRNWFLVGQ